MLKSNLTVAFVPLITFVCVSSHVLAAESGGSGAVVTVIQGTARVYSKEENTGRVVKKGRSD